MKNKIILTILILSVIALVFSGCGGGNLVTPPIPDDGEGEPVTEYAESTTDQEGICNFTLIGGKLSVEVLDAETDETIGNIECYLSTDGTDAVLLLVDPAGEYVPRLTSWQDEYSTKGYIWGKIKHCYLHLKSQFLEGGSHLVYIDEYLPEGLTKEILNEQYNYYYTTELKNLRRDLRGLVNALIDMGIGYIETTITSYALASTVIGSGVVPYYNLVSSCYTLNEILKLGVINDLASEYEISGYEPDQDFEIWEAKWPSADFGSVLILPTDIPNSSIHPTAYIDSINPNPALQGENVSFTGHGTDPDGEVWFYRWESNIDGLLSILKSFNKSDLSVGTHTISFKVYDAGLNLSDAVSESLTITPVSNGSKYEINWSNAESNGWANPLGEGEELITSTAYDYNSDIYLNNWGKKHTGTDIIGELDGNVYSIASGTIVKITRDYSSTSNQSVVIIKHTNSNNEKFFAIYGHVLARSDLEVNSELEAGEKIGTIKKAGSPVHLHFGINLSSEITDFIFTNSNGQWGWGRIPASANPSDYGWVDPIDYLNVYLPLPALPSLTPEEVELIRKWGFGDDDIVRRWPDGDVNVYDETNYTRMQDILNEWNAAIGGPVVFHLSNDPNSPVKVKFDPDISQDLAGQYLIYCSDDDYEFYRADVNIQKNYLDSLNSDTKYCLYLWLFSGVTGFNIQADVDPNPFKEWWNFDKIPDDIKTMLHGLYKVPCGYNLLDKKLKENWSQSTVRNLQNIYEGKLYEYK